MMFLFLLVGCQENVFDVPDDTYRKQEHMAEYFNVLIAEEEVASFELNTVISVEDFNTASCRIWYRLFHINFGAAGNVTLQIDDQRAEIAIQSGEIGNVGTANETALDWQIPAGNYNNRLDIPCEDGTHTIQMFHDMGHKVLFSVDFVGSVYEDTTTEASIQTAVNVIQ